MVIEIGTEKTAMVADMKECLKLIADNTLKGYIMVYFTENGIDHEIYGDVPTDEASLYELIGRLDSLKAQINEWQTVLMSTDLSTLEV